MAMVDVLSEALNLVKAGETAALSTIVSSKGSLPMSKKAKMLVSSDGKIVGTVGGGCLEADVWAEAKQVIETGQATLQQFVLTEKHAGEDGLTCGGTVEIFTEPLGPDGSEEVLGAIDRIRAERASAALATLVSGGEAGSEVAKLLVRADGTTLGSLGTEAADAAVLAELEEEDSVPEGLLKVIELEQGEPTKVFVESICPEPALYLFGGGHVSLAIARVAQTVGFHIVVVDDRDTFANRERFPMADDAQVLELDTAFEDLAIDDLSYLVAVTRGHQYDKTVIRQAVRTNAAYIGMIGSRRKIALMWKELEAEGVRRERLDAIHAPIGLDIGADTPAEIAVSVVAELIQSRRSGGKPAHEVRSLSAERSAASVA
ncbi:MAG: XdhC family protein [Candidatus Latescibacteria bacterium]|jgi:xanthine dehydrogenase accessory factor|nr:XdhC family protein [Candidatus Latescibacterota bacterium]